MSTGGGEGGEGSNMLPLTALLDAHFASEQLEFRCEKCPEGTHVKATSALASLPRVLIVQLNRFATDPFTGATQKVHTLVPFPLQLSLAEHCVRGALPGTELVGGAAKQEPPPVTVMAPPPLDAVDNVTHAINQRIRAAAVAQAPLPTDSAAVSDGAVGSSAVGSIRGTYAAPRRQGGARRPSPVLHEGSHHSGVSLSTLMAHAPGAISSLAGGQPPTGSTPDARAAFTAISSSDSSATGSATAGAATGSKSSPTMGELWSLMQPSGHTKPHASARMHSLPMRPVSAAKAISQGKRAREEQSRQAQQQDTARRGWGRGHSQAGTSLTLDACLEQESPVQNLGSAFERARKVSRRGGLKGGEGGDGAEAFIDLSEQSNLATPAASGGAPDGNDTTGLASPPPSVASSEGGEDGEGAGADAECVRGVPLVGASPKYELQAVVCHDGSGNAQGHYTCLARGLRNGRMQWGAQGWEDLIGWGHVPGMEAGLATPECRSDPDAERKDNTNCGCGGEQWWLYNDSSVKRASADRVQSEEVMRSAYVLAYVLKQPYT